MSFLKKVLKTVKKLAPILLPLSVMIPGLTPALAAALGVSKAAVPIILGAAGGGIGGGVKGAVLGGAGSYLGGVVGDKLGGYLGGTAKLADGSLNLATSGTASYLPGLDSVLSSAAGSGIGGTVDSVLVEMAKQGLTGAAAGAAGGGALGSVLSGGGGSNPSAGGGTEVDPFVLTGAANTNPGALGGTVTGGVLGGLTSPSGTAPPGPSTGTGGLSGDTLVAPIEVTAGGGGFPSMVDSLIGNGVGQAFIPFTDANGNTWNDARGPYQGGVETGDIGELDDAGLESSSFEGQAPAPQPARPFLGGLGKVTGNILGGVTPNVLHAILTAPRVGSSAAGSGNGGTTIRQGEGGRFNDPGKSVGPAFSLGSGQGGGGGNTAPSGAPNLSNTAGGTAAGGPSGVGGALDLEGSTAPDIYPWIDRKVA